MSKRGNTRAGWASYRFSWPCVAEVNVRHTAESTLAAYILYPADLRLQLRRAAQQNDLVFQLIVYAFLPLLLCLPDPRCICVHCAQGREHLCGA